MAPTSRFLGTALLALPLSGVLGLSFSTTAGAEPATSSLAVPADAHLQQLGTSVEVDWTAPAVDDGTTLTAWVDGTSSDSCSASLVDGTCTLELSDPSVVHDIVAQTSTTDPSASSVVVTVGSTEPLVPVDPVPPVPPVSPGPGDGSVPSLDGLTASASDGSVVVSWTSATGPGQVFGWASNDEGSSWGWCWSDAESGSCTINGLADGVAVDVQVTAVGDDASSETQDVGSFTPMVNDGAVAPSAPVLTGLSSTDWSTPIPVDDPGVPVALARQESWSGTANLTASFTAPSSDGGSPVRSVDVTATDVATGDQTTCSAAPADGACDLWGLHPSTTYVVTATATNGAGTSPASDPLSATTPADPTAVDIADVALSQDPTSGAWWVTLTAVAPASASTLPIEVVDDQGDACTVTLSEGDASGTCQLADPGADRPTGLVLLLEIFPVFNEGGVVQPPEQMGDAGADGTAEAADGAVLTSTAAAGLASPSSSASAEASAPTSSTEAPAPASSADEPATSGRGASLALAASSLAADRIVASPQSSLVGPGLLVLAIGASLLGTMVVRARRRRA